MMKISLVLLGVFFFVVLNDATTVRPKSPQKLTLRGRVVFPNGARIPVERDGILTVELQDTSLADAPAKVIAKGVGKAIRFPMAFAIKYTPDQIAAGMTYSLRVSIRNKKNELLYTNDMNIGVIPTGPERTKLVDVPVILVKKPKPPTSERIQFPELVGKNGEEAVKIIKEKTGFKSVMIVPEGSILTMDYRLDRVRVFVNKRGLVSKVPVNA